MTYEDSIRLNNHTHYALLLPNPGGECSYDLLQPH